MDLSGLPLSGLFQDDNGGGSSTRLVFVLGSLTIIFVWAWLSVKQGAIVSMGLKDLGILLTVVGAKLGGKALEVKENTAHKENEKPRDQA